MSGAANKAYIPHVGWLRHAPGEEVISLLRQGYFEAREQAFYWLYLRPGDTCIDCGAHIGLYSVIAARATGGGARIIALEPGAATADHLEFNLRGNGVGHAEVIRAAAWSSPGSVRFIEEAGGKAAYAHVAFGADDGGESVAATTLDAVVAGSGAGVIALAKIDVEGAEPEALEGAREAIGRGALPLLMVEFTEKNLQARGLGTADLFSRLEALGYTVCEFSPATMQLVAFKPAGPVWFMNLFACTDMASVNRRLAQADERNREVARDILARALACDRFRELEELERYRTLAGHSEEMRAWAVRSDELLASESRLSRELREWAQSAEEKLGTERRLAVELRERAERSEHAVVSLEKELAANRPFVKRFGLLFRLYNKVKGVE